MKPDHEHQVVAAVLVRGSRVLLCHRHPDRAWYPNVWDLPGGHIHNGEQPLNALVRELQEELGITVDPGRALSLGNCSPSPEFSIALWQISEWEGDVVNAAPEEHDALAWFTIEQLDKLELAGPYVTSASQTALRAP